MGSKAWGAFPARGEGVNAEDVEGRPPAHVASARACFIGRRRTCAAQSYCIAHTTSRSWTRDEGCRVDVGADPVTRDSHYVVFIVWSACGWDARRRLGPDGRAVDRRRVLSDAALEVEAVRCLE